MVTAVFEINGQTVIVNDVDPHCTLLSWLRASGRTGAKEGCAEGECGACAVACLERDGEGRPQYVTVNSCLMSLADVHGRSVLSVEGLAPQTGALHAVQQALATSGGSQCGYCTPGFVMSLFSEHYRAGRAECELEAISGNLCRCTGYRPIIAAARGLAPPPPNDPWLARLEQAPASLPPVGASMSSRFARPESLTALLEVLARRPDAVLLAGGTDLMADANLRDARYPLLVSLSAIDELRGFEVMPTEVTLGAALPLSEIERRIAEEASLREVTALRELLPLFSSRLIKNRATLGGNLATASPIGDAAPVLLALGAELTLASARGLRRVALRSFFTGYRKTLLVPGELIASVHLPRPLPRFSHFYKVSKRTQDDIATVSATFALDLGADGRIERFGAAYGGIAATPFAAEALSRVAVGQPWSMSTLHLMLAAARGLGTPQSDQRGSAAYREAMVARLLERFFLETRPVEAAE